MVFRKWTVRPVWVAALLLGVMFALALTSLRDEAPTFDEQGFLVRGLAYLRGEANGGTRNIRVGHPLGLNALNAALLVNDPTVRLPSDDPAWGETGFHRPAELFLWGIGNDVARTMFLARVPTIWLGLLLAAVAGRWTAEMATGWGAGRSAGMAGVLALGLVALDPNILAHTRLVTTDLGLAAGAGVAGYTLWRFLRRPSWSAALLAGAGLGLLQNTKFTAALFVPLFALVVVVALWARRRTIDRRLPAQLLIIYPAMALLTLWATNGFQVGPLNAPLPLLGDLGGRAVPLSHYLDQLLDIGGRLQVGTPAFLLGRYSDSGWWWYFPVAFLVKTPLPVLLLLLFALLRIVMGLIDSRTQHNYLTSSVDHHSPFPSPPGRGTGRGSSALASPNPSEREGDASLPSPPGRGIGRGSSALPSPNPSQGEGDAPFPSPAGRGTGRGSSMLPSPNPSQGEGDAPLDTPDLAALLIPAAGYFAIALTTDINLGYRHLLAILPFLYVLIGVVTAEAFARGRVGRGWAARVMRVAPAVALLWLAVIALWLHPHYLSFFNVLAGGPDNGWRVLVDSNIDWGQDLARLKTWQAVNGVERVWLSYFGEGRPEYYGIVYDGLDSFPPRLMNPGARPFYPHDPAPGWYAISATTLQGVHFADHDQFRFFRERRPDAKIGYSIFLYNVPARGEPADLLLSNTQVDELTAVDFALLQTNDVRLRWFDGDQALLLPDSTAPLWLLLPVRSEFSAFMSHFLTIAPQPEATGPSYRLYRANAYPPQAERQLMLDGHAMTYTADNAVTIGDELVMVTTGWRQGGQPRPIKIYVHVRDAAGQIVAQWDGLGAAWEGWRLGDTLVQTSTITLPESLAPGDYRVVAGLYDPLTNQRWRFADGQDGVELFQFALP